jgi:hypothetical protein
MEEHAVTYKHFTPVQVYCYWTGVQRGEMSREQVLAETEAVMGPIAGREELLHGPGPDQEREDAYALAPA